MDGWIVGCNTRRCIHVSAVSAWLVLVVADACCLQQSFWLPKTASEPACACADGWIVGCDTQRSMLCSCLLPLTPVACSGASASFAGINPQRAQDCTGEYLRLSVCVADAPGLVWHSKTDPHQVFSTRANRARSVNTVSSFLFCEETLFIHYSYGV